MVKTYATPVQLATSGEDFFQKICEKLGYSATKIPEMKKQKTPDFEVMASSKTVFAEVKDLTETVATEAIKAETDREGFIVGDVDLNNTSALDSKLSKIAEQLFYKAKNGYMTIGVLFDEQFHGPVSVAMGPMMRMGKVDIPPEISAVILLTPPSVRPADGSDKMITKYIETPKL
jgi:hypothetical protein